MIARLIAGLFLLSALPAVHASARTVTGDDYKNVVSLNSPAISPDGRYAAVIAQRVEWNEDRRRRELIIVDTKTHAERTLFVGRKGLDAPSFSPDGSLLAILAEDGKLRSQIYVMAVDGSQLRRITHSKTDIDVYAWRRDGRAFAYTAADPEPARKGAERFRDSFIFTTEPVTTRSRPEPLHVFVQPLKGAAVQLTFGAESAAEGNALSWSPDGRTLALVLCPNAITNDQSYSRVALLDVNSKRVRALTGRSMWEGTPLFSPDGRSIAYTYSDGDPQVNLSQLYLTSPAGGPGSLQAPSLDRSIGDAVWSADASSLIAAVPYATTNALYAVPLRGDPTRLPTGELTPGTPGITTGTAGAPELEQAVSRDGSIAFIATSTALPPELYVRSANGAVMQLTHLNTAFASAIHWARAQRISYPTSLGITADGVLYTPPGFSPNHKYPLVVYIHGGPTDPSMQIFDFWAQVMAARGWLVLRPNYRGSPNLGLGYQRAVLYDPEDGPGKDIMAALERVRARGIVDDSRIAVSGWSYGGIMTAWMISKYHIWRAAVSGASVNDWITDYGTADDSLADRDLLHGSPFIGDEAAEWRAVSAITYAKDVTTPVLILSDVGDNRDPFATSSMYWRALRDNRKDAAMRVWPIDGHFPSDPVRTADVFHYWIDYIAQHFR